MSSYPSIFNDVIGPVMRGPSSSHCAASLRIARICRDLMDEEIKDILIEFDPNGSLATTHKSQGSDMGLFGGFDDHLFERKFSTLSGGEKRRVGLAKLLIDDLDLILFDEPTNHLDVEGVAWLAEHLNQRKNCKLLIMSNVHPQV